MEPKIIKANREEMATIPEIWNAVSLIAKDQIRKDNPDLIEY